jgi:N-acyl-D-aspartate/D-glutamate deacylase
MLDMKKFTQLVLLTLIMVVVTLSCQSPKGGETQEKAYKPMSAATEFDLVVLNGRVMDPESNFDGIRNVGIKDGVIGLITEGNIEGKETIDATGLIVSPGFVDLHAHAPAIPFSQKSQLRDGITTALECEVGAYPVDVYYDNLNGKSQVNYGATVSVAGIREKVAHPEYNSSTGTIVNDLFDENLHDCMADMQMVIFEANDDQINTINEMVEENLKRGALGIGVPVGYMMNGTTPKETVTWQAIAGKYGVSTFLHGRFSSQHAPTTGVLGLQEMISSLGIYGGGLYIHHIHQQTLANTADALRMVDDASKAGMKIIAEVYPYYQGASIVGADYLHPDNYSRNMGRTYKDIIEVATMKPLTKERYEELMKTNPSASIIFAGIDEAGMLAALADPNVVVGSDGMPMTISENGNMAYDWDIAFEDVQGHPRGSGAHAKVLRLARDQNLMPLMLAISKISYMPAKYLEENGVEAAQKKGRLQVGADADVTIFDAETVTDNSTMTAGGLASTGIPYVIVNGTVVVKDSKVKKGVFPGKPVRRPIID